MSFSIGVGDIIAISNLARKVWSRFRDSPDQFNAIQTEVAGLCLTLDDIANSLSGFQTTDKQAKDLSILVKGCRGVLDDTNQYILKNESLSTESTGLGSRTRKAWGRLTWDPAIVNELRDRMVANATFLNAFNASLASQVSRATSDKVNFIAEEIQGLTLNQSQKELEAVLQWISRLDFAPQQSDLSARRQEGTGLWLLESQEFLKWRTTDGATLVCQGMPGAGKTMLTSLVVDHLQQFSNEKTVAIAYIYCDYRRRDEQTPINLASNVVKQLLRYQISIPEEVVKIYDKHLLRGTRSTFDEVLEMIGSTMEHSPPVYIIIDALDELGDTGQVRRTLIERLRLKQVLYHFNLMITSRYIPSLALEFNQPLCMDICASPADIRMYVQGHISDLANCVRKDLALQKTIESSLVDVAEGMFLLVQLHMDSLRDKTSTKLIKKALEVLPKGSNALDLAYDEAMQRVENQREGFQLLAKQLLGWLTYSMRLMSVEEAQHALAIEPGTPDMDEDNLSDVNEIVGFCAGLVIVDEETQIIRLVHHTTQEYFRRKGNKALASAQHDVALSCLTYLMYDKFEDGWVKEATSEGDETGKIPRNGKSRGQSSVKNRIKRYPFLSYATKYWAKHERVCGERNVKDLMIRFARDNRRVSSAGQVILYLDRRWTAVERIDSTESRTPLSAMHVIAYLGYEEMVAELLYHQFEADAEDTIHRTPLWWAAWRGHHAVVKMLLSQHHVRVNHRVQLHESSHSGTPLGVAAERGEDETVRVLVEREDVDVNSFNEFRISPLNSAARRGYSTIVDLLLTRNRIEVNSIDDHGWTPLSGAAYHGHENIVELLLRQGNIQVNLAGSGGRSPLGLAAEEGHSGIVQILLGHSDIEVNRRDHKSRVPLSCAAHLGQEHIFRLLLRQNNIEINLADDEGYSALELAAKKGHEGIVRNILGRSDVEVNLRDLTGQTALHCSAILEQSSMVKLLLSHAAIDVNSKDKLGQTALHMAARYNRAATVQLLLEHANIDVNPKDGMGYTPLQTAVIRGREASVRTLLCHVGVEVDSKDYKGKTPLSQAMIQSHGAIVRLLCAHPDVNLNPTDFQGRDLSALVEKQQDSISKYDEDRRARITLELEECRRILRLAIEARSRNGPQNLHTESS